MKKTVRTIVAMLICIFMISLCACNNAAEETSTNDDANNVEYNVKCLYCGNALSAPCATRCSVCGFPAVPSSVFGIHVYNSSDICIRCGEGKLGHWMDENSHAD